MALAAESVGVSASASSVGPESISGASLTPSAHARSKKLSHRLCTTAMMMMMMMMMSYFPLKKRRRRRKRKGNASWLNRGAALSLSLSLSLRLGRRCHHHLRRPDHHRRRRRIINRLLFLSPWSSVRSTVRPSVLCSARCDLESISEAPRRGIPPQPPPRELISPIIVLHQF